MRPHRDTLSARLVQHLKRQIKGVTRRQRGNGRVLRRRLLRQSQCARTRKLNGDKPGRVKFSYEPVTQKFFTHMKSETKLTMYGHLPDVLGFSAGTGDLSTSLASSARRFEAWFPIALGLFEHRRIAHRRRQDCTTATTNRTTDGDGPFRPCPVHFGAQWRIPQRRNRDKGRHGSTSAIRTRECDGDASLSTAQLRTIQMNYDDYYARQVGGALPYFTGDRVQRGLGFGSLFSGLLRSVAPLIMRGAVALGKHTLTTRAQIAGKNVKKTAKRRTAAAGSDLKQSLLNMPPPPGKRVKRIKRVQPRRRDTPIKRRKRTEVFS